jgi:hypothetical protein
MMPMRMRRKTRKLEKVENLCRTATVQKILPDERNQSDHARAIPFAAAVDFSRSSAARRNVQK